MNPYIVMMSILIYLALSGYVTAWYIRRGKHGAAVGKKIGALIANDRDSDFIRIRKGHIFSALFGFCCDVSGTIIMEVERVKGRIKFHPVPPALDWFHLITAQGALFLFIVLAILGFMKRKGVPISRYHVPVANVFFVLWISSSVSGWFYRIS